MQATFGLRDDDAERRTWNAEQPRIKGER